MTNQPPQYTADVGRKFHEDGSARRFAGNTIICSVQPDSHIFSLAEWVQAQVKAHPLADKFSFLPPSSFHMTVMELLCDEARVAERWIPTLPLDATLRETDDFFRERVPQIALQDDIRMRFTGLSRRSFTFNLAPIDKMAALTLAFYREAVAQATGVRFPNHDDYQFHISLAYRLIELTGEEEDQLEELLLEIEPHVASQFGLFEPAAPQLTFFDDMFRFVPIDEYDTLASR